MVFQEAIGEKISSALYILAIAISGVIVAFITGWLMAFVVLSILPLLIVSMYFYMKAVKNKNKRDE